MMRLTRGGDQSGRKRRGNILLEPTDGKRPIMLYTIAIVLLILWLVGFVVVPVGGGLIHLLLAIAVVVIVIQLLTGRRVL
jgi:hypothetical protein